MSRRVRLFVIVWLAIQITIPAVGLVAAHVQERPMPLSWQMWSRFAPGDE